MGNERSYWDKVLLVMEQSRREGYLLPRRAIFSLALVLFLVELLVVSSFLRSFLRLLQGPSDKYSGRHGRRRVLENRS